MGIIDREFQRPSQLQIHILNCLVFWIPTNLKQQTLLLSS